MVFGRSYKYCLMILSGMLFGFLSSCTPEHQMASMFVKKMPELDIQLITPQSMYKYNHKGELIQNFDSLNPDQQDSALYADSRYIKHVSDSMYLEHYVNSFIDELRALGFKVFLEASIDSVLLSKPQAYVLNMVQAELDEYLLPFEDSEPVDDTVYYKKFMLNAVDASYWFELNKLNTARPVKTVLYSEFSASDGFSGNFFVDPFTARVRYKYRIDSLEVKDIYELATYSGKKNASYLFDFFMNQYVAHHMPGNEEPSDYFHYNRFRKMIIPAGEEQFEVLDTK